MTPERCCPVCDEPLRGRQKLYCSNAHGTRLREDGLEKARADHFAKYDETRRCQQCGGSLGGKKLGSTYVCSPACRTARSRAKAQLWPQLVNVLGPAVRNAYVAPTPPEPGFQMSEVELRYWETIEAVPDSGHGLGECWEWQASLNGGGYGQACRNGERIDAHRLAYELFVGPIPAGYVVDHVCRNRRCANPLHLEAITQLENLLRGNSPPAINARKTHCDHGHPLSGKNLYRDPRGRRQCRTCRRDAALRYQAAHPEYRDYMVAYAREYRRRRKADREALAA